MHVCVYIYIYIYIIHTHTLNKCIRVIKTDAQHSSARSSSASAASAFREPLAQAADFSALQLNKTDVIANNNKQAT